MTQMELEQQLGGLFSLLTVEFLVPYLNRKLNVMQRDGEIVRLPKGLVRPTIVAGINALGRGQDRESLTAFLTTIAQTLGPEALTKYVSPDEAIKRLATSQGIDILNLIKTMEQQQAEMQQQMGMQKEMAMVNQTAALAKAPMFDPSKNPEAQTLFNGQTGSEPAPTSQEQTTPPGFQPPN
jgi:hypothetical protein